MELGVEDEEALKGSITSRGKSEEEIRSLLVNGERLRLKDDLKNTIGDGEEEINNGNPRCSDGLPL
jgi:hypothetical protein